MQDKLLCQKVTIANVIKSPMILIGNQMVYSLYTHGIFIVLDKMRVKVFPNFTRHHLITHTYNFNTTCKNINWSIFKYVAIII